MLSCSLKRELEMKLTENRVDTLIDTLNDLICDEQSITREQRENLIKTVATLGGLKERLRLISAEKEARQIAKNEKVKKPREPDWCFPVLESRGCQRTSMLSIPLSTIYLMTELMITSCGFQNSKGAPLCCRTEDCWCRKNG